MIIRRTAIEIILRMGIEIIRRAAIDNSRPPAGTPREISLMNKGKAMIAIVDDDESVCRALKRLVRSLGMEADTFLSGQEFLDLVEAMPSFGADCVVLDVQMPLINGLEVQRRLAAGGSRLPIIFITAHDDASVRERALGQGAVAFLRKPFDEELFIRTLHAALARGGGAPPGAD